MSYLATAPPVEQANYCMRERGYCVICTLQPYPIGYVGDQFGFEGHKVAIISRTDGADFDAQTKLLGKRDDPERPEYTYFYYRAIAE